MDFLADQCGEDTVLDVVPVEARGMEEVAVSRPSPEGEPCRLLGRAQEL